MNLLIVTQILDTRDSNLGFFHRWVEEFALHCEKVTVICLKEGVHHLPQNVKVLSLGKEHNTSRVVRVWRFFSYIRKYKNEYDAVFVHMNPEYILLGARFWRRWGKKISLWYVHKSVTRKLRLAVRYVDVVFSASRESFRIESPKVHIVGHGIDTEAFKPDMRETSIETRLVTSGRVAPSKHLLEMLDVLDVLWARGEKFSFTIIGAPVTSAEEAYAKMLQDEVARRPFASKITLAGPIPHQKLPALLNQQDLFLNFSTTGSMDKAGLEALATGIPVISTNEAYEDLLSPFELYVGERDYNVLADAINRTMRSPEHAAMVATLRNKVIQGHSLTRLIPTIVETLKSI